MYVLAPEITASWHYLEILIDLNIVSWECIASESSWNNVPNNEFVTIIEELVEDYIMIQQKNVVVIIETAFQWYSAYLVICYVINFNYINYKQDLSYKR